MRYYRIKDRIYDGSLFLREHTGWYFHEKSKLYAFTESDIIKQADDIEELCDGYYVDKNKEVFIEDEVYENELTHGLSEALLESYFVSCVKKGIDVYAFIKTDKGLIYVAKMNDKGEWELC